MNIDIWYVFELAQSLQYVAQSVPSKCDPLRKPYAEGWHNVCNMHAKAVPTNENGKNLVEFPLPGSCKLYANSRDSWSTMIVDIKP
jgi:hypothetical protein